MSLVETVPPLPDDAVWHDALAAIRSGLRNAPPRWESIFGPLRAGLVDDLMVVGQIGQSLDGRTATMTGHSHYINGSDGLDHLHRLRALVDAVVVGSAPRWPTIRCSRCAASPGRIPSASSSIPTGGCRRPRRRLRDDGVRRLVITRGARTPQPPAGIERIALPVDERQVSTRAPSSPAWRSAACGAS